MWKQELLYVKRNKEGIIVAIQEEQPDGYFSETAEISEQTESSNYRIIGD